MSSVQPTTTDRDNIFERVSTIVARNLSVSADKITLESRFAEDLGADSLDTVELVMALEEEFGCEIPDDAAEQIRTVGDAVRRITTHYESAVS